MELENFLNTINEQDSKEIKALIKDYVRPLSVLANYYLSTKYTKRVADNEFNTIVDSAKYDGVLEFVSDIIATQQKLEE